MKWTNEEISILKEHYASSSSDALCHILPGRTKMAIRRVAQRLGLKRLYRWLPHQRTTIPQLTPFQIGYIAGFFDGEGTFSAVKYKGKQVTVYPIVTVSNTKEEPLRVISEWLNLGYVVKEKEGRKPNHCNRYRLQIRRLLDVWALCEFIKDSLIIKREHAKLVKELAILKATKTGQFIRGEHGQIRGTILRTLPREYEIFDELKQLNARGKVGQLIG